MDKINLSPATYAGGFELYLFLRLWKLFQYFYLHNLEKSVICFEIFKVKILTLYYPFRIFDEYFIL